MPYRVFHNSPHDADTVRLMMQVFDEICTELGLANREDRRGAVFTISLPLSAGVQPAKEMAA